MEIIEFGCALATRDSELLDSQSFLVRPTQNPVLSEFCKSLTSIQQSMVDAAPVFSEAFYPYPAKWGHDFRIVKLQGT
jgi:inhibitor of KinA sporulation pathway (predicted exonuclease)